MKKYKYFLLGFNPDQTIDSMLNTLNQVGADGWQIVSTLYHSSQTFPNQVIHTAISAVILMKEVEEGTPIIDAVKNAFPTELPHE